jgi:hypothetical protein
VNLKYILIINNYQVHRIGKIKISIIEIPVILNINKKYKKMIKQYKKYEIKSKFLSEFIFQIILNNAIINYKYLSHKVYYPLPDSN